LAEARRNRALRSIAEYRGDFAKRLERHSDKIIEQHDLVRLEHQSEGAGIDN
jgi:hypothetical protein